MLNVTRGMRALVGKRDTESFGVWRRGLLWAVAAGTLIAVAPLSAASAQEPPQPNAAPRNAVEKGPQVKKGDVPPAKDVPASELAPKPTDNNSSAGGTNSAGTGADGSAVAAKEAPEPFSSPAHGHKRADLLKKLLGGSEVVFEKDDNVPPTVVEPLHLDEMVALALKQDFAVKAATAATSAAKWDKYGAYGAYMPSVQLTAKDGKEESKPGGYSVKSAAGGTYTISDDTHHAWSNNLTITQPIIDTTIIAQILSRTDTHDAAEADEFSARQLSAFNAVQSFFRVTKSRLLITFAQSYKDNLDKLAQRMRDRVSGGGAPGVELDRINARSTTANAAIVEAQSEYQAAVVEFRRLSGVSPVKLSLPDSTLPLLPDKIDDVLTSMVRNNPDYKAASKRADAAIGDMQKSFSALLPKFNVEFSQSRVWDSGGIAKTDPSTTTGPCASNIPAGTCFYPNTRTTSLMGVFTWSLNGGTDVASGMAGLARAEAASYSATDLRMKLDESLRVAYDAMKAANIRIESTQKAMEANGRVAATFEEQYLAGTRQLLDLLDAYERLYQSQTELVTIMISEIQAAYLLRRQMGELDTAILSPDKKD